MGKGVRKRLTAFLLAICICACAGAAGLPNAAAARSEASPFGKHSISLEDDIAVNFYLDPTRIPAGEAVVVLSYNGKEERCTLNGMTPTENGYRVSAHVSAKEMTEEILAELIVNGQTVAKDSYSVVEYADAVLGSANGAYSDELIALVKAMLLYGAKAQLQFRHKIGDLADQTLDTHSPEALSAAERESLHTARWSSVSALTYGVKIDRISLLLHSKLSFRLYFRVTNAAVADGVRILAKLDGQELELQKETKAGEQGFYVEIPRIAARAITDDVELTFRNADGREVKLTVNCGEYIKLVLDGSDETLKTTVTALYRYHQAAKEYFRTLEETPEQPRFEIVPAGNGGGWLPLIP